MTSFRKAGYLFALSMLLASGGVLGQEGGGLGDTELPEDESGAVLEEEDAPDQGDAATDEAGSPSKAEPAPATPAATSGTAFGQMPQTTAAPNAAPEPAAANPAPAATNPPASSAAAQPEGARAPQPMEEPSDEAEEDEEKSVFGWFSVAPEVGYLFFPQAEMTVRGFSATVEARHGLIAKLHFDLGGDGLAFEIAPLFAVEFGGITPQGGSIGDINLSQGFQSGNFQAVGGQLGLVYRFAIKKFFPSLGISFHGAYLMGDEIDYGAELYGRIPIGFSAYMGESVAFVMEVGLMLGVSGVKTPLKLPDVVQNMPEDLLYGTQDEPGLEQAKTPADIENWYNANEVEINEWIAEQQAQGNLPTDYSKDQLAKDFVNDQIGESIRYGFGFGLDVMIGLRFP